MTSKMENQLDKLSDIVKCIQKCLECAICLERLSVPVQTRCGHLFCNNCIMAVAMKKGAVCPLCKEPISRRSISIDTQAKDLSAGFEALFDAIQTDIGINIRTCVNKPGNGREGIRTPCKSNILVGRKNMRMNVPKSHLLRNAEENKSTAGSINLNESAKRITVSQNFQHDTCLGSSDGHDVDHENDNTNSNLANIKYMETLKGIDYTQETVSKKKVAAWLETMEWGEELETIETKHNRLRNTNMPSERSLPCATGILDELNVEGSSCKSSINKITSDETKTLNAGTNENSKKTNKLSTVAIEEKDRTFKPSSRESNIMSKNISEITADEIANSNLKYKGIHLRVQEISKKLVNTSANDSWSRVMQFGNCNNTVNTKLSSNSSTRNQRIDKGTLSKDNVIEDTEETNAIDDVRSLKSSGRNSLSGDTDGSTVIMSNISYTPIISSGGVSNTTNHSLIKTNINNNRGLNFVEKTTSEPRVMSLSNSCVSQCEEVAFQKDQLIDPDHKMHNNSLRQRRLQLASRDIERVSTNNITAKNACLNDSNASNEAIPLLSSTPNFQEQLARHFGSPNRIQSGKQQKNNCISQNVTTSPPKLTLAKGRSLSQQLNLTDANNYSNELVVQKNVAPISSSIPNFRDKLYQKGTLHASNSPNISKNVEASSTLRPQISADPRKTINSVANLEYAETVRKRENVHSKRSSNLTKNETVSSQKCTEKLESKRTSTEQQNGNNTIKKFNKNIQFFYMGRVKSGMLKAQIRPSNDVAFPNETVTNNRFVQTSLAMSDLNIIEEQKLIIEKQRLTIEEQRLIMAKQDVTIKKQETIINEQKSTIEEKESATVKRDFSERNVEFSNKYVNSRSQMSLQAFSQLLEVGATTNEILGQNDTSKQNSSARTSMNKESNNIGLPSQSILNNLDSENQHDNEDVEQQINVLETNNISKNERIPNFINSEKQQRYSTAMYYDSEKKIRKEPRVEETPEKNTKVKYSDLSCDSPVTKQLAGKGNSGTVIGTRNIFNTKLNYTTDCETSEKRRRVSQEPRRTYKRIIIQDSTDVDSDPLEVSLPSKNSIGIEACSKSYINLKSEKTLKNNFSDVITGHKRRSQVDRKRSTSSLIDDDMNVDVIMNDWCSRSKLSGLNNQENNSKNCNTVTNIVSRNIKQIEKSIDMAWKNTKTCQVDVVDVDQCDDEQTSLFINKKNISKSTFTDFDEKFTPKTDESCDEVRTRKRKLSDTEGCVNAKDLQESFFDTIVTKVRRIQNDFVIPEKDLHQCEVTPTKNVIASDSAKSAAKNVDRMKNNGMLLSDRVTANVMSDKDHVTNYQSHGKIDTQDRMAMEDNFNEAIANVDTQLFVDLTIEGEHEQSSSPPKINPADQSNFFKSCQSSNAPLDSKDTVQGDSPASSKPEQTKLHVDSSMKSASKKFKEFFNLSQFSNNSNKENCNVNVTQDKVLSTIEHNSIILDESSQQRLVPSRLKLNRTKAQDACNKLLKTAVNSSTDYQFEEKNTRNKNVVDEKKSDSQSVTSATMDNQHKGVSDKDMNEHNFCERDSLTSSTEGMTPFKNIKHFFGKSKVKVVKTPAVEQMASQNASLKKRKSILEHTTDAKNCSPNSCNKDYDIPYSENDVVEEKPQNKLKVSPHAPNTSSRENWMSLNLTPIPKIIERPSIATPIINCPREEQPVASYSNTVSACGSKVLETPNRDSRLFMLYESTPKISHTARNSWVVPEARLKERKSQLNLSTTVTSTSAKSQVFKSKSELCFLCTTLSNEQIKNVQRFAKLVNAEFTNVFRPEVTHVIVATDPENNSAPRTLKYLQAIAHRKWVVSYSWVLDSLKQETLLDEEKYEPLDIFSNEPVSRKSRLQRGALFEGFAFLCIGPFKGATVENYEDLVRSTGGHIVRTLDALAASDYQWKFIIIPDVIHDNELIGWYQRTKAVPVLNEWLLECISQYALISLHSFIRELTPQDLLKLGFPLELIEPEESDVTNDTSP